MSKIDYDWVARQMTGARIKVEEGEIALKLLETWEGVNPSTADAAREALNLFLSLAQGHALMPEAVDEVWIDVQRGNIVTGDEVRVKHNAFDGEAGEFHNGRRGKVLSIRYGDVIFRSTDGRTPAIDGAHYSPYKLEKRIS